MKTAILVLSVLAAILFTVEGVTKVGVKNAQCQYCPSYSCYSSSTCLSCSCMKRSGEISGECVYIGSERIPAGFEILP